jgi:hypothetical protein
MPVAGISLSLVDLEAFDPRAPEGRTERRFCCPLCGEEKPRDIMHRCLTVNAESGAFLCHRCEARGVVLEKQRPAAIGARPTRAQAALRQAFALPTSPASSPASLLSTADIEAMAGHLRGMQSLIGTAGAEYLAGRGIPAELAKQARSTYLPDFYGRPAVIFPVYSEARLVAAQGRYIDGQDQPRMRNVGAVREGVFATPGALAAELVAITEAPIDALSLAVAGLPAVALLGKDARPAWLRQVLMFRAVLIATDSDEPGEAAAASLASWLSLLGAKPYRLRPSGECKDWNDMLKEHGEEALSALLDEALRAMKGGALTPLAVVPYRRL